MIEHESLIEPGAMGALLAAVREDAGLSQADLGARAGLCTRAVHEVEVGAVDCRVGALAQWLAACGVRVRLELEPMELAYVG